ncbi:hypothetical protein CYY_002744 [Polysphondylium violaceum]|uniref:Uncharacterized protein n=1 Tax=Polysphondylium violaceum TaxID=133409 RepID=A0A8J4Q7K2_9MYCE|nr:hypothetical protein CYY_002744 [Polysphondylium violaceum]
MTTTEKYKKDSIESFIQTCYADGQKNNASSFQFDSANDIIYFLSNNADSKQQLIHYIDMKSDNKSPTPLFKYVDPNVPLSIEAQLQRERQRVMDDGITQYSFNKSTQTFIVPIGNNIHQIDSNRQVKEIPGSAYLQTLSSDSKLVAFVSENNIWVTDIGSGVKHQLTFSNGKHVKNGDIGFVYAEEFSRYTGYWWSPKVERDSNGNDVYSIFYIREDETKVREFLVSESNYKGGVTTYKYPLAGDENSVVSCHLIRFHIANNQITINNTDLFDLKSQFPWMEYIVRANFTPDGANVWAQLVDRNQQHLALVLIPLDKFTPTPVPLAVLVEEKSDYWVNVVDLIYFCKKTANQLIWSSESSGYRHLYLISWDPATLTITEKRPITQASASDANWLVHGDKLFVDEDKKFVYFIANKETPLEAHLYVASYAPNNDPTKISRLTKPNFYHSSIEVSDNFTRFVATCSNITTPLQAHVYKLEYNGSNDFPTTSSFFQIVCHQPEPKSAPLKHLVPENFTFKNSHGVTLYGQVIKPENFNPETKYPTVLYVYGGPHVQIVRNQYEWASSRSLYARLGFIVVMIDNMGSTNRGIEFEGKLRCKMGTLEINDQVEGLEYLMNQSKVPIDRNRIAITGWSYGGYLSLMGIAQRPDFFKIAISGAPVTLWESYNTGYTERYMGVPKDNVKGYEISNVSHYIDNFPSEENRLIIIHGLQDENVHFAGTQVLLEQLTTHQKPYILKLLVKERHSIRNMDTRIYIESHNIKHLLKNL